MQVHVVLTPKLLKVALFSLTLINFDLKLENCLLNNGLLLHVEGKPGLNSWPSTTGTVY